MRIESLPPYRYLLQVIKEDPQVLKPYAYLLVSVPVLVICFLFGWDRSLMLFIALAFACTGIGFMMAYRPQKNGNIPMTQKAFQNLVSESAQEMMLLRDNQKNALVYTNIAGLRMLGFEAERNMNICFEEFIVSQSLPFFKKSKSTVFRIEPVKERIKLVQMRKQNGQLCWMELIGENTVENGRFTLFEFRDTTESVLLKKATQQFAKDLIQRKARVSKIASVVSLKVS